jgi:N-acetylmuramoyl-L-alanine amidase
MPTRIHHARLLPLLLLPLLGACAHVAHNPLATWVPSKNFDERRATLIVLHYTDEESAQQSLDTLRTANSGGPVSAHYLVGRDGHLYQLVADGKRAWHAGAGSWGTITDVNSSSIGIEIDNDGHSPFPQAQIDSLLVLLDDLCTRLRIPRAAIVGHQDFAPARKPDPGPLFPWRRLAEAGFGHWPQDIRQAPPAGFDPWLALRLIGYPLDDPQATVRAYRNHYRGDAATALDAQDLRILYALTRDAWTPPPAAAGGG